MRTRPGSTILTILLGLTVAGCDLTAPTTTTLDPIAPTTTVTTTDTGPVRNTTVVSVSPFAEMGPGWTDIFIPFGFDEDTLGPPGADGSPAVAPQGTNTADGTWWLLDVPNRRIARFSDSGNHLGSTSIPPEITVIGSFAFQDPTALDDGMVIAHSSRGSRTALLVALGDAVTETSVARDISWDVTDGSAIYGRSPQGDVFRLQAATGTVSPVDWFQARDGSQYLVTISAGDIVIDLPDAGAVTTLQVGLAEQPEIEVSYQIAVETGSDGSIFVLIHGSPLSDPGLGVGGLVTISPSGEVTRVQAISDPIGQGSIAQMGVTPLTSSPWLIVTETEGVRIYTRLN
jgi:hypothetical protein